MRKRTAPDAIATNIGRARNCVINEWQTAHIKEGLSQADAGKFAKDCEVAVAFAAAGRTNSKLSARRA